MKKIKLLLLAMVAMCCISCSEDDNGVIGGSSDMGQNEVGAKYDIYINLPGLFADTSVRVKPSSVVTQFTGGITTISGELTFNSKGFLAVDSLLGTREVPVIEKLAWLEKMRRTYGFVLDTAEKGNQQIRIDIRAKITDEGIAHYTNGDNKLFTLVKYDSKVGDKYEYTSPDGIKYTRTVVAKDENESFELVFWKIKVMTIEETFDDPLIEKVTYLANHKVGLVSAKVTMKNGKTADVDVVPLVAIKDL